MTDKEKERLKDAVERAFGYDGGGYYIDNRNQDTETILSLINRQVTEDEAWELCDKVEQGFIHRGSQPMANNGWEALRVIRKALGIGK